MITKSFLQKLFESTTPFENTKLRCCEDKNKSVLLKETDGVSYKGFSPIDITINYIEILDSDNNVIYRTQLPNTTQFRAGAYYSVNVFQKNKITAPQFFSQSSYEVFDDRIEVYGQSYPYYSYQTGAYISPSLLFYIDNLPKGDIKITFKAD